MRSFNDVVELNIQEAKQKDMSINLRKYLALERELLEKFWAQREKNSTTLKLKNYNQQEQKKEEEKQAEMEQYDKALLLAETNAWLDQLLQDNNNEKIREFKRLLELVDPSELYGIEETTEGEQSGFNLIDETTYLNGKIHDANLFFAAAEASFGFAISVGSSASKTVMDIFDLFQYAMQATMITLTMSGLLDTAKAYLDKNNEDRHIVMLEGINRSILGTLALTMSFNAFQTASFAIPLLFYGIVLGFAIKDHLLLQKTKGKRIILERQLENDKNDLRSRLNQLNNDLEKAQKDPKVVRLSLQIAENQKNIDVLKEKENSLRRTRNLFITLGLVCATLFFIASFSNPFSAGLIAVSLSLFFVMGKIIERIKKHEMEKINHIQAKKINSNGVIRLAREDNLKDDKPINTHIARTDVNPSHTTPLPKVMQAGGFLFFNKKKRMPPITDSIHTPLLGARAMTYA